MVYTDKQMRRLSHAQKGFTLIEIMIAAAIVTGIMAAVAGLIYYYQGEIKKSQARTVMQTIKVAIMRYQNDTNKYPETLRHLVKSESVKGYQGPYLPEGQVPLDPWGNKFQYRVTPGQPKPYELFSYGQNGRSTPKDQWIRGS